LFIFVFLSGFFPIFLILVFWGFLISIFLDFSWIVSPFFSSIFLFFNFLTFKKFLVLYFWFYLSFYLSCSFSVIKKNLY
jgi:hypothetical protein